MIARPVRRPGPIPFVNTGLLGLALSDLSNPAPRAPHAAPRQGQGAMACTTARPSARSARAMVPPPVGREVRATFRGHGVLCVRSSASGALYRFEGHGASLVIDPRDALMLRRLSDLQVD